MKEFNVKAMSVDELLELRDQIDKSLLLKVAAERRDLEARLTRLSNVGSNNHRVAGSGGGHPLKGAKIPPKYQGPGGETWAGRGALPRWLSALIAKGHKLEEFAINKTQNSREPKRRARMKRDARRR
jgi:DNA-binding protein H-NS